MTTGWRDWEAVQKWNTEDWSKDRENLVARLASMRFRAINQALKKNQIQTAALLMAQLGATVQETESLVANSEEINLNISIEKQD